MALPYPPLEIIEADGALAWTQIDARVGARLDEGVSLCVLAESGVASRGGYFFHLRRTGVTVVFSTFEGDEACAVPAGEPCAEFINHVCGRRYSERMWRIAQRANLRADAPD